MSESVKILIEAENKSSPVVAQAAKDIESKVKAIKATGEQAKKSTEFFGTIANVLGGSEIGAFASQLGQVTEKTSQFAEVQKLGGAGALAFKAGLVAAVGAIAFQFGNAIGNAIFQTERWKKALADAKEEAKRLEGQLVSLQANRFAQGKSDIELIRDPDAKRAAQEQLFSSTNKEIEGVEKRLQSAKKKVDEYNASWTPEWIQGNNELMEEKYKTDRAALDVLVAQREEMRKENIERELANEEIKKQNALKDKSDDYLQGLREEVELLKASKEEQAGILALRNAIGDEAQAEAKRLLLEKEAIAVAAEAAKEKEAADKKAIADQDALIAGSANYVKSLKEQLEIMRATDEDKAGVTAQQKAIGGDVETATNILKEMEAIKATEEAKKKADDIQKKADADKEAAAIKIVQLKESELARLEQERILLTQGAEAAKAFALQKQGLSKTDATSIAKQEAEMEALKKRQELLKSGKDAKPEFDEIKGAGPVVASESRLLKRGSIEDPGVMVAKNTTKMIEQNDALRAEIIAMQEELRQLKENANAELEIAQ